FSSMLLSPSLAILGCCAPVKPIPALINPDISRAPRLDVMTITHREKSTRRLSPSVNVPLSSIPSNSFHNASSAVRFFPVFDEYVGFSSFHFASVIMVRYCRFQIANRQLENAEAAIKIQRGGFAECVANS